MPDETILGRTLGFVDPAGTKERALKAAEAEIVKDLTDKQLSALIAHMESGVREVFFHRHPDLEQRVHLYGMRKLTKMILESAEEK